MKTEYKLKHLPEEYGKDAGDPAVAGALAAAATPTRQEPLATQSSARAAAKKRVKEQFEQARQKLSPDTQPRDSAGKYRKVLARLKMNLGDQASEELAKKLEDAEAAGAIGDFKKAKTHGAEVVKLINNVEDGSLKKGTLDNIRKGSKELGKLLAYLPMPQGDPNAKVRFSDLPAPTAELVRNLIKRVEGKLSNEDAAAYVTMLRQFMSGALTMDSDTMNAELAKVLRVLA